MFLPFVPVAGCLGVPDILCLVQGVWVFLTCVPVAGCLGVPDLCVQEERAPHPGEEEEQAL